MVLIEQQAIPLGQLGEARVEGLLGARPLLLRDERALRIALDGLGHAGEGARRDHPPGLVLQLLEDPPERGARALARARGERAGGALDRLPKRLVSALLAPQPVAHRPFDALPRVAAERDPEVAREALRGLEQPELPIIHHVLHPSGAAAAHELRRDLPHQPPVLLREPARLRRHRCHRP